MVVDYINFSQQDGPLIGPPVSFIVLGAFTLKIRGELCFYFKKQSSKLSFFVRH